MRVFKNVLLLFLTITLLPSFAYAAMDGSIHIMGSVKEKSNKTPISGVKIEVLNNQQKTIGSAITDGSGHFIVNLRQTSTKPYAVRASHLIYKTVITMLPTKEGHKISCPTIYMEEANNELNEIVYTSTRTPKYLREIPIPTQVIGANEIKRIGASTVKDLLLYAIPGIEFTTHGFITKVRIQGYDARFINFLIDGEEMAGLKEGSPDFLRINPDNIERIEFVRGSGSALYGSNAIGGVINIITKKSKRPFSLDLGAGYIQGGQYSSNVLIGLSNKYLRSTTAASIQKEGGYSLQLKNSRGDFAITPNRVYRASERLTFTPCNKSKYTLDINGTRRIQELTDLRHDHYDTLHGLLGMNFIVSPSSSLSVTTSTDLSKRKSFYPKVNEYEPRHLNTKETGRIQFNHSFGKSNDMNLGVEVHGEQIKTDQIDKYKSSKHIMYGVLYAQHLWKPIAPITLLYGGRVDYHSTYGGRFSPKVNLGYTIGAVSAHLGYSAGFRAPQIMELYYNWSHLGMFMIYGNKNLQPETSKQISAGLEYNTSHISASVDYTRTAFTNEIYSYQDTKGDVRFANSSDRTYMNLVNVKFNWTIVNGLRLNTSYLFSHNPVYLTIKGKKYNMSTDRPHNIMVSLQGYKGIGNWSLSGTIMGQYLSDIHSYDFDFKNNQIKGDKTYEGYTMMRATSSIVYKQKYRMTLGIDNLLNFKPKEGNRQTGFLPLGRSLFIKVGLSL